MNIKGLDGREYSWNPSIHQAETEVRSSLHTKAKELLQVLFPYDRILEEVSLPGSKTAMRKSTLRADLFVPNRDLIVEVHGEQHYKFNSFFHKNKMAFYKAKARDRKKSSWADINSITYIELPHTENDDEWRKRIFDVS